MDDASLVLNRERAKTLSGGKWGEKLDKLSPLPAAASHESRTGSRSPADLA